jgi:hypothetical protein
MSANIDAPETMSQYLHKSKNSQHKVTQTIIVREAYRESKQADDTALKASSTVRKMLAKTSGCGCYLSWSGRARRAARLQRNPR